MMDILHDVARLKISSVHVVVIIRQNEELKNLLCVNRRFVKNVFDDQYKKAKWT